MKLAVIFPGQGSQSAGMLAELSEEHPAVLETFQEASDALGYDLWSVVQEGGDKLNQTEITQPAMLSAGVACYRVWQANNGETPSMMAGHSLGEYTALVCAGAMDFSTAVKLVETRGKLMQAAVPEGEGAMAAVLGLEDDIVRKVCEDATGVVEAVNFNSPGQVVIAGAKEAVDNACALAKEAGAKRALVLPVSVPSHSSLMKPAAEQFAKHLEQITITTPQIPVVNNVDATVEDTPAAIREALVRQLHNPVLWVSSVAQMSADGVTHMIEAGPGKVLTGLGKRIDKTIPVYPVLDSKTLDAAKESIATV